MIARLIDRYWRRRQDAGHIGATEADGIGFIPAERTMAQIAADGADPLEAWLAASEPDPYEQLVEVHTSLNGTGARLSTGIDAAVERFLAAHEAADTEFVGALNAASSEAWISAADDLRHEWYEPIGATPWTRADFIAQRVATTWKGLQRNVRKALREATGPLPVIELAELYREASA